MGGENHVALTEAEFIRREALGLFAVSWQAHGFRYGIGREIDSWLECGQNVLVNGSRQHLEQVRARYGAQLLPVCIEVSPSVLAARLRQRGRENEEAIAQRLARAAQHQPEGCLRLNNDGALADTVQQLRQLLALSP